MQLFMLALGYAWLIITKSLISIAFESPWHIFIHKYHSNLKFNISIHEYSYLTCWIMKVCYVESIKVFSQKALCPL